MPVGACICIGSSSAVSNATVGARRLIARMAGSPPRGPLAAAPILVALLASCLVVQVVAESFGTIQTTPVVPTAYPSPSVRRPALSQY